MRGQMAKDKDENGDGGKTENVTGTVLTELLKQLVTSNQTLAATQAAVLANQPARVITEDSPEYAARNRAEGFYDYFPKRVYQNGREAEARGLSEQTRERAASLAPGKYLGGKVMVEELPNGGVHIKYKSRTIEDRMAQPFKDFPDLVDQVWAEMSQPVSA